MAFGSRRSSENVRPSCRDAALAALGRRALTRSELERRLARKGYSVDEVAAVLDALASRGLIDDGRTAAQHVRSRGARSIGKRRVAAELSARGVPAAERATALGAIDPDEELARLREALAKRMRTLPARLTPALRSRKLFDHLVRRGFASDAVLEAIRGKGDPVDVDE